MGQAFAGQGRLAWPRRAGWASAVAVASLLALRALPDSRPELLELLGNSIAERWSFTQLWDEFLVVGGLPLALLAALGLRARGSGTAALWVCALLAGLPFVVLLPSLPFEGTRGYYLPLFPFLAFGAALGLGALGRGALPAALALVPVFAAGSAWDRWSWENEYEGVDWVPALEQELGEGGMVLVGELEERDALFYHSRLHVLAPRVGDSKFDLAAPTTFELLRGLLQQQRAKGAGFAVLRSLADSEDPAARTLMERLQAFAGRPEPGQHPAYVVYPRLVQSPP